MIGYSEELLSNSWIRCWGNDSEKLRMLRDTIIWRYNEPTRFYHNESHLIGMIHEFQKIKGYLEKPSQVELSIWIHDLVNDIGKSDNEERSFDYFVTLANQFKVGDFKGWTHLLKNVMATKHIGGSLNLDNDGQFIHDIDLITFSSDIENFRIYCNKIRNECYFIDNETYFTEVVKLFQIFLDRPKIYLSDYYHNFHEDRARNNLRKEIERMKSLLTYTM